MFFFGNLFLFYLKSFDQFLGTKFPTFKRYSLEGGESSMAFYYSVFKNAALSTSNEKFTFLFKLF